MNHPYDMDLTPKQRENWQDHGKPVYDAIPSIVDDERFDTDLDADTVRDFYTRLVRPKKRGDGMMDRDAVKLNGDADLNYLRKEIDDWFRPMQSLQGVVMAGMMASDKERMEEVARVIALAKLSLMSDEAQQRVARQHARRGRAYGIN